MVRGQPSRSLTQGDIAHYQRIIISLGEEMRLMKETDQVIEELGPGRLNRQNYE